MSNMVVRTNNMAINSHRSLGLTGNMQSRASQRLSSGFRINSAADDAAGLAISEKMRGQIRGLDQASRNAQDGISLIQTAEGAMSTVNDMVIRIRELVVQAANDTNAHETAVGITQSDRAQIQREINALMDEIDATAARTQFNTRQLIDGSLANTAGSVTVGGVTTYFPTAAGQSAANAALWFHVGANLNQGVFLNVEEVSVRAMTCAATGTHLLRATGANNPAVSTIASGFGFAQLRHTALTGATGGTANGIMLDNGVEVNRFLGAIDIALAHVAGQRANLGAMQNRLEFNIENLDIASENLSAANSRIRDADMAQEMMRFTQSNVLQQAAISMLAQANQAPQSILSLLR